MLNERALRINTTVPTAPILRLQINRLRCIRDTILNGALLSNHHNPRNSPLRWLINMDTKVAHRIIAALRLHRNNLPATMGRLPHNSRTPATMSTTATVHAMYLQELPLHLNKTFLHRRATSLKLNLYLVITQATLPHQPAHHLQIHKTPSVGVGLNLSLVKHLLKRARRVSHPPFLYPRNVMSSSSASPEITISMHRTQLEF
jgi:hypothetical protein